MPIKPPVHRPPGIGDKNRRPYLRSAEAEAYRRFYRDKRWCGPHGVRQLALLRDLYTCQRCNCLLTTGKRHHPRAAVVNHKKPHKGDEALFFDLENTEAICKSCHDALIQKGSARLSFIPDQTCADNVTRYRATCSLFEAVASHYGQCARR